MQNIDHKDLLHFADAIGKNIVVCITDGNGVIRAANNKFCSLTQLPEPEVVGQNYRFFKSDEYDETFFSTIWSTVGQGRVWQGEIKTKEKRGSYHWLHTTVIPLKANGGDGPDQYIVVHTDITESKTTEKRLNEVLKELEDQKFALDQSAIVATTDERGVITYVNDRFCEISGYGRDELVGKTHQIVNSGHHPQQYFADMWQDISAGKVWRGEICNKKKDGSLYWVETTIVPFLDSGKPYQYTAIRKDITYKKEAQEKIKEERAKTIYAEKMASLGEMSAGIAHELGNPLGVIRGRMEMMQEDLKKGQINCERLLKTAESAIELSDQMTKIIRGMRSYARDGSNDPFIETPIQQLISDILEFSSEKFRKLGVQVYREGIENEINFDCREAEIGQVIVNLVSNACDAVKDQENRWVKVSLSQSSDTIQIAITDSGPGIPAEIQSKVFDAFYSTKGVGQGTGLGLSISKRIIESHNGSIVIDSKGPHFKIIVTLPKKQKV